MCGICGVLDYKGAIIKEGLLLCMCQAMRHRGPDDEGIFINGHNDGVSVGLGHRRLKIIDLYKTGHQPMSNEDKTIWLVFNGEIYNFKELKTELLKKNHIFQSNTDTECVIHLYEEYGEDCVSYLRGMFTFAIWDRKRECLMLARDRIGKKPVLYHHKFGKFCFASEFCALLASGFIDREINSEAIDYYLTFGYIPAPLTIYKDVFKLPPAHILILKDDVITLRKYWELNYQDKITISEQEAAEEVLKLLREAVKIRLYSDVPLGAFLSGGVDSSAVVALMSRLSEKKVKTFSIGFSEAAYNELGYARRVAQEYGTEHHEFVVKPKAMDILPLLVERYGEPHADSSCIPTYYVACQTKKYVTVALNGDGGDELFAGYERYWAMLLAENFQKLPYPLRIIGSSFAGLLPDSTNPKNKLRRIKRFAQAMTLPVVKRYKRWVGIFDDNLKSELYSKDFSCRISGYNAEKCIAMFLDSKSGLSLLDRLLLTDTMTYLPNDLLVKVDITSMSCSLEARSPFLDHVLMEFAASLPVEYKMNGSIRKHILKQAVKDLVPASNIYRPKMGFGLPVAAWFRNELKEFLSDHLFSSQALSRGYFKPETVKGMFDRHVSGKNDYSSQLWALLMLEMWHKQFID